MEFLDELPLRDAKLVISTLPDVEAQHVLVKHIRMTNQKTLIIANLSHVGFLEEMYAAGADYIMMPHLLSGQWMADILKSKPWNKETFKKLCQDQKEEMKLRFTLGHH